MSTVSLDHFKAHLGETVAASADDDELQRTLDAAEAHVAKRCGPLPGAADTVTVHATGGALVLPRVRLKGVAAVRDPDGNVAQLGPGAVNLLSGIVQLPYRRAGAWQVDLDADGSAVPPDLQLAILIIAAHLWETQRVPGANRPQFGQGRQEQAVPRGFAIPNRAATLMAPYLLPVIA